MNTTNNIAVARLWYRKGKNEYFSLKQFKTHLPYSKVDFHIVLDEYDYRDEWSDKIDNLGLNITFYSKQDILAYINLYGKEYDLTKFIHSYHLLIGHYLRRVKLYDYMLTYEYDIIFNNKNLDEVIQCINNKIPFGIYEPDNRGCDKALFEDICRIFDNNIAPYLTKNNPQLLGINAGFQGINLSLFDQFLSNSDFHLMMSLFDFSGIHDENGKEKWGELRTKFDTQEQSFYSIFNQLYSDNFKILNPIEYFFSPCWEDMDGYIDRAMKSKIVHFTGHKKAQKLFEIINNNI